MTVIFRPSRLLPAAACVLLAAVNSGCYNMVVAYRDDLQADLSRAQQELPRLEAEKGRLQVDVHAEEEKLSSLQTSVGAEAVELNRLQASATAQRADLAPVEERGRALEARIAAVNEQIRSLGPVVVPPDTAVRALSPAEGTELKTIVLELMKLEDWLKLQQRTLSAEKDYRTKYAWWSERLRVQAHLVGLAQVIECLDMPTQANWLDTHPIQAVKMAPESLGTIATVTETVRNDILVAAEQDSSLSSPDRMERISKVAEKVAAVSARLGTDLLRSVNDPQAQALGREYQALAQVYERFKAVAEQGAKMDAEQGIIRDANILLPARQSDGAQLIALWSAKTAVDAAADPDPAYARMVRNIEFVEWVAGSGWSPDVYLSGRIRAVQRQRLGIADRLGEVPGGQAVKELSNQKRQSLGMNVCGVDDNVQAKLHLASKTGALVLFAIKDSPAEKAGIRVGDVIVRYDGQPVDNPVALLGFVTSGKPGQQVIVVLLRNGKELSFEVQLADVRAVDEKEQTEGYRKAAEEGFAVAQSYLGTLYLNGTVFVKDEAEAVKWFRKAAAQNEPYAQTALGGCYLNGRGITKDEAEAVKWFRKAAEEGFAAAQNNLGYCFEMGRGVAVNRDEAIRWYTEAAKGEDADSRLKAKEALARLQSQGVQPVSGAAVPAPTPPTAVKTVPPDSPTNLGWPSPGSVP